MNRKLIVLFLISLFLVSIFAGVVSAQGEEGLLEKIGWFIEPGDLEYAEITGIDAIDGILNTIFRLDVENEIHLKVIFAVFLFILLFGISQMFLGKFATGIRVAMAIALAVISTIAVPARLLMGVSKTYGILFFSLLMGIPIVGGIYLMLTSFKEKTRENYIIKCAIAGVLWYVMGTLSKSLVSFSGLLDALGAGLGKTIGSVTALLNAILFIMMIYYAFKIWKPSTAEAAEVIPERAQRFMRRFSRPMRKLARLEFGQMDWELIRNKIKTAQKLAGEADVEANTTKKLKKFADAKAAKDGARNILTRTEKIFNRIFKWTEYLGYISAHIPEATLRGEVKKEIAEMTATDEKIHTKMGEAQTLLEAVDFSKGKRTWTKKLNDAEKTVGEAETAEKTAEKKYLELKGKLGGKKLLQTKFHPFSGANVNIRDAQGKVVGK